MLVNSTSEDTLISTLKTSLEEDFYMDHHIRVLSGLDFLLEAQDAILTKMTSENLSNLERTALDAKFVTIQKAIDDFHEKHLRYKEIYDLNPGKPLEFSIDLKALEAEGLRMYSIMQTAEEIIKNAPSVDSFPELNALMEENSVIHREFISSDDLISGKVHVLIAEFDGNYNAIFAVTKAIKEANLDGAEGLTFDNTVNELHFAPNDSMNHNGALHFNVDINANSTIIDV